MHIYSASGASAEVVRRVSCAQSPCLTDILFIRSISLLHWPICKPVHQLFG